MQLPLSITISEEIPIVKDCREQDAAYMDRLARELLRETEDAERA